MGGYKPPYDKNSLWVKNGNIFHYNEKNKKWVSENIYWYLIPGDINKSFFPNDVISRDGVDIPINEANITNMLYYITDEVWNISFVNRDVNDGVPPTGETITMCGFASYDIIFTDHSKLVNIGHESPLSANCRIPSFFADRRVLGTAHNSWGFIHNQNYKNFIIDIFNKFKNGEINGDSITIPAIIINGIYKDNVKMIFSTQEMHIPQDSQIITNIPVLEIGTDSGWGGIRFAMHKGDLYIRAWAG